MPLPPTVRVKLSSEAAEYIALTPVVVQEMSPRELVEEMLGVTGKDVARIRELLARGTLVSGASRFRWSGWDPGEEAIRELLATFPDPDPTREFAAGRCVRAVLRGARHRVEIPRAAGARKGVFRRTSFWDALMETAAAPVYGGYSYKDRADWYIKRLDASAAARVRDAAGMVAYSTLREQIRGAAFDTVEFYVERKSGDGG